MDYITTGTGRCSCGRTRIRARIRIAVGGNTWARTLDRRYTSVSSFAPANLVAGASGTTSVTVSWMAVPGATSYQVVRSSDGAPYGNVTGGVVSTTNYSDPYVVSGKTYLYKVKALVSGLWTDFSAPDLATTITFTDDNTLAGTAILALHLQQIRTAVNAVMTAAGQTPIFGSISPGAQALAKDITDLRSALTNAYGKIGMPSPPGFAEPISPIVTTIRASHFQEIREAVK